jgi:MFS family permease
MGLLLGGVLTTYANWRWVLFVNVPASTAVLFGVSALIDNGAERVKIDLPGAITSTLGVGSLVFAVTRVGEHGWSDAIVKGSLALALLLLIAFVVIERTSKAPMIPPGVLNEGGRLGANIIRFITAAGMFATFYFLTLYLQHVLGYSPLRTGLMFLPFAVGFGIAAGGLGPQLLHITSERVALSAGPVLAAGGMLWFSFLTAESSIFAVLLPASLLTGLGLGITQVVATSIGVRGIDNSEAGIGASLLTASSQVGGALGLAVLATVSSTVTRHQSTNGAGLGDALTHGYRVAFLVAAGLYVLSLAIAHISIRPQDRQQD